MARCSSARERGITNRAGWARWEPDQLTHSMTADGTVRVMDVEPERVAELQRQGPIQLIDVREDYEWDAGRIPGARHLALGEVAAQAETIHRETPVVFYCRVGGRSAMAASAFQRAGYEAYNMTGGLLAWARADCRSSPRMGVWRSTDRGGAGAQAAPQLVKVGDFTAADLRDRGARVTRPGCS